MITPLSFPSDDLSPIAKCLIIAAARGRALRAMRERAGVLAVEEQADDESQFASAQNLQVVLDGR